MGGRLEQDVLGTQVCPGDFRTAARRHGRHCARYLYASTLAGGKRVLDAACGGGFGSAYLAGVAGLVLGLDLDEAMIRRACQAFSAPNLRFRIHDLHQAIDFAGPFDLITSFETLEHVRDGRLCLRNLADALAEGGTLMVSVPNGAKELAEGHVKDYHRVHFSAGDFEDLLGERFEVVEFYSQVYHRGLAHYLAKLAGRSAHHARHYRFRPGLEPSAKTWLALCRQRRP